MVTTRRTCPLPGPPGPCGNTPIRAWSTASTRMSTATSSTATPTVSIAYGDSEMSAVLKDEEEQSESNERVLRPGQIYQERKKVPVRYVQLILVDEADGTVTMIRIGPAAPQSLGRRTVRNISSFRKNFEFVLEEEVYDKCSHCGRPIKNYHYPDHTKSEYRGADGRCSDCSTRFVKK